MKSLKHSFSLGLVIISLISGRTLCAQQIAYDNAGNYLVNANWTNGANLGYGFTPWIMTSNGPDFQGQFIATANNPPFVIDTVTNVLGTNYDCIWGTYANGADGVNAYTAYRGFTNQLGTNTFVLQWGSIGAGTTTVTGIGTVHGWCGFSLRYGNTYTNTPYPNPNVAPVFDPTTQFYLYFLDGASPSTLYVLDGAGNWSVPNTSFSNLGRNNITNAVQAEITPSMDGMSYYLVLRDCVQHKVFFTTNSILMNANQGVDSVALFCNETTGDQVYNQMEITAPTNIAPTISNLQPADGSLYVSPGPTNLSFEVDSFNSTVLSSTVSVYLNGVLQGGSIFNTASPTSQLLGTNTATLSPNTFYTYTIVAEDANGNVVSNNYTFNTFSSTNNIFIDAMDYNYLGGQFINPPGVALYGGLLGTNGIDYFDVTTLTNENNYRPEPGNPEPPSPPLPQLLPIGANGNPTDPADHEGFDTFNSGLNDYQLAYTDQGEWDNYTRIFPTNTYNVYARAASAAGAQFQLALLANPTASVSNQPLVVLGTVNVPNTGGSTVYSGELSPLVDFFGNTVLMPFGGTNTLQQQATQSKTYNLSYLTLVTNASAGVLGPYISVGSPAPGASGVGLISPVTFTLVNRQTSVKAYNTNNILLLVNGTNIINGNAIFKQMTFTSNSAGGTVTWTPTANLPATNTINITVIFTNSANAPVTNLWSYATGTSGGVQGSGLWTGNGGPNDMIWADAVNWTNGTPGPGFAANFASLGETTTLATNNIVSTNITIQQLNYETNNSGYCTTWIQDGVTLTITNNSTTTGTQLIQVGAGGNGVDNSYTNGVTNTITGNGGTLFATGNPLGSASPDALNFQVRQAAPINTVIPNLVTLDMSGLGTFIITVGKFYVAQGGTSSFGQTNVSGCCLLAKTNIITCLRTANAGQFEVGDSSGGGTTLPGSSLFFGKTNTLYLDTVRFGKQKATNNIVAFNPAFISSNPSIYLRGTNGSFLPTNRVSFLTIGDADAEPSVPDFSQAVVDLSGGSLNALVFNFALARGSTNVNDTGYARGTFTFSAGTLNASTITNGWQRANNNTTQTGIINVNGSATLVSPNIVLAQAQTGANGSLVSGTINVTNGTVQANITSGGGISTVNVNGGTLIVSNAVCGTSAVPLSSLNLVNASLQLNINGSAPAANINATNVSASGTIITIDNVANITGPTTIHLISYTGSDPYSGLSLALLPFGYNGSLVDNSGGHTIDLSVTLAPQQPQPTINSITLGSGGSQAILKGTNNFGAGGTYRVLSSTNLLLPLTNWTVWPVEGFDVNGDFSFTNSATNKLQFYILQVP